MDNEKVTTQARRDGRTAITAERRKNALDLRKAGASLQQIAESNRCSIATAKRDIDAALKLITQEPAKQLLELELARLDSLYLTAYGQAKKGNLGAIDRCVKIMERRAKYLGLDERSGDDGAVDAIKDALASFQGSINLTFGGDDGFGSEYVEPEPEASPES